MLLYLRQTLLIVRFWSCRYSVAISIWELCIFLRTLSISIQHSQIGQNKTFGRFHNLLKNISYKSGVMRKSIFFCFEAKLFQNCEETSTHKLCCSSCTWIMAGKCNFLDYLIRNIIWAARHSQQLTPCLCTWSASN